MHAEKDGNSSRILEVTKAKFRMALWLLLFYLITLVWASLTFPFLGYTSSVHNVIHGIIVASPFWITISAALLTFRHRMRG